MSRIQVMIDGHSVTVEPGTTILAAAQQVGIAIPTLCHHPELAAFGGCRICLVEAGVSAPTHLVAACIYPIDGPLQIQTGSERIHRIRKGIVQLLLAHAPHAPPLLALAETYGARADRFDAQAQFCIHCGLCVRYCAEVRHAFAVGFVDRGTRKEIAFIPEVAAQACPTCKACFPLCPTSYAQAAYALFTARTVHDTR